MSKLAPTSNLTATGNLGPTSNSAPDPDALILVDEADRSLGFLSKKLCHEGQGVLHRAFSLLIFNESGELLIQQRAASKRLWPMYWSNSCCSHPCGDETMETATRRRLYEELGIHCPLHFLFKFQYQAQFDATGAENELCSVFVGRCREPIKANSDEIHDWRWIDLKALNREIAVDKVGTFTPWFKLEWARIWRDHRQAVLVI
jgi:isopentenyl-diphosphate Delta-isomerase